MKLYCIVHSDSLHGPDELARRRLIGYIGSLVFRWETVSCRRVYYKLARGRLSDLGAGIVQWLEHRTRDWKVAGSNPCWNGGRIFFSRVDFLWWLLFRYPFHPRVTTVARKKIPVILPKGAGGRLQLNTHTPYVCGFYWTVLRHWSQLVPNMSNDIWGH